MNTFPVNINNFIVLMNHIRTLKYFYCDHSPSIIYSIAIQYFRSLFFSPTIYTLLIVLFNWFLLRYMFLLLRLCISFLHVRPSIWVIVFFLDLPACELFFFFLSFFLNFSLLNVLIASLRTGSLTLLPGHHLWGCFESTVIWMICCLEAGKTNC